MLIIYHLSKIIFRPCQQFTSGTVRVSWSQWGLFASPLARFSNIFHEFTQFYLLFGFDSQTRMYHWYINLCKRIHSSVYFVFGSWRSAFQFLTTLDQVLKPRIVDEPWSDLLFRAVLARTACAWLTFVSVSILYLPVMKGIVKQPRDSN